jgi:hypothetical protein
MWNYNKFPDFQVNFGANFYLQQQQFITYE